MKRPIYLAKGFILRRLGSSMFILAIALPGIGWPQAMVSNKMPLIEVVGTGDLSRTSEKKDQTGRFLPPWTSVEVTNVFGFKTQPRVGSRAMFVPVNIDLEPFELNLKSSTIQDGCGPSSPKWWSAEFQPITDKRIHDIAALPGRSEEYPFDVVVIYPSVSSARQIPAKDLRPSDLPKGVKIAEVKSAIEVTGDGMPDIVVTEYCCNKQSKLDECDYTCGATYIRSGKGWSKTDDSKPC